MFKKTIKNFPQSCHLHWQITSKCDGKCKHCFIAYDSYGSDLSKQGCLKVLKSFVDFVSENGFSGLLTFTGGHPFLKKNFWDILKAAGKYQRNGAIQNITIEGNPSGVDKKMTEKLKKTMLNFRYKLSIDGLESSHDSIRGKGSFKRTLKALRCLHDAGIQTTVNCTLSRSNFQELPDIIDLMVKERVFAFIFSPVISLGRGKDLKGKFFLTPGQYRKILIEVLGIADSLDKKCPIKYSMISFEHLFARLFYELGRFQEYQQLFLPRGRKSGCDKGLIFSVLPDGAVRPRRLIPVKIGQAPKDSFQDIYNSSGVLKSIEDESYTECKKTENKKCRLCPVVAYCGHALGGSYHISGSFYEPAIMCWVK